MRNGSPVTCAAERPTRSQRRRRQRGSPTANADRQRPRVITANTTIATGAAWKTSRNGAYQNTSA